MSKQWPEEDSFACAEYEPFLERLLFGELEEAEKVAIEQHLEGCSQCRTALADAKQGLAALDAVDEPPLPFPEEAEDSPVSSEAAWSDFQKRVDPSSWKGRERGASNQKPDSSSTPWWLPYRGAAAAALLLVGFGAGQWFAAPRDVAQPAPASLTSAGFEVLRVEAGAVEALARAELLSDVGLRYVIGLQDLLQGVMTLAVGGAERTDLSATRDDARGLIRDGRLLRRSLDPAKDELFLSAINRAELFLEELAAVEGNGTGTGVRVVQAALLESQLSDQIAAIDLESEVDRALEGAGWIGEDFARRKEF